ncbi:TBC domain-containing protein [Cyclospora cayetanensis]|uniref:TBC domain-containing protein n=1 Tax=Cyclospora cayetanensis TaxID=88456 RepID=A0A1D3D7B0_9EIME|nr:TBC domain-containing protein [Cyclospora cayetanensis]
MCCCCSTLPRCCSKSVVVAAVASAAAAAASPEVLANNVRLALALPQEEQLLDACCTAASRASEKCVALPSTSEEAAAAAATRAGEAATVPATLDAALTAVAPSRRGSAEAGASRNQTELLHYTNGSEAAKKEGQDVQQEGLLSLSTWLELLPSSEAEVAAARHTISLMQQEHEQSEKDKGPQSTSDAAEHWLDIHLIDGDMQRQRWLQPGGEDAHCDLEFAQLPTENTAGTRGLQASLHQAACLTPPTFPTEAAAATEALQQQRRQLAASALRHLLQFFLPAVSTALESLGGEGCWPHLPLVHSLALGRFSSAESALLSCECLLRLTAACKDSALGYLYFMLAHASLHRRDFAAAPQHLLNAHEPLDHCLFRPCPHCLLHSLRQQQQEDAEDLLECLAAKGNSAASTAHLERLSSLVAENEYPSASEGGLSHADAGTAAAELQEVTLLHGFLRQLHGQLTVPPYRGACDSSADTPDGSPLRSRGINSPSAGSSRSAFSSDSTSSSWLEGCSLQVLDLRGSKAKTIPEEAAVLLLQRLGCCISKHTLQNPSTPTDRSSKDALSPLASEAAGCKDSNSRFRIVVLLGSGAELASKRKTSARTGAEDTQEIPEEAAFRGLLQRNITGVLLLEGGTFALAAAATGADLLHQKALHALPAARSGGGSSKDDPSSPTASVREDLPASRQVPALSFLLTLLGGDSPQQQQPQGVQGADSPVPLQRRRQTAQSSSAGAVGSSQPERGSAAAAAAAELRWNAAGSSLRRDIAASGEKQMLLVQQILERLETTANQKEPVAPQQAEQQQKQQQHLRRPAGRGTSLIVFPLQETASAGFQRRMQLPSSGGSSRPIVSVRKPLPIRSMRQRRLASGAASRLQLSPRHAAAAAGTALRAPWAAMRRCRSSSSSLAGDVRNSGSKRLVAGCNFNGESMPLRGQRKSAARVLMQPPSGPLSECEAKQQQQQQHPRLFRRRSMLPSSPAVAEVRNSDS